MARERKITLFSRNLVKIEKTFGIDFEKRREPTYSLFKNESTTYEDNAPISSHYEKAPHI